MSNKKMSSECMLDIGVVAAAKERRRWLGARGNRVMSKRCDAGVWIWIYSQP
jgi:hypothetical protein